MGITRMCRPKAPENACGDGNCCKNNVVTLRMGAFEDGCASGRTLLEGKAEATKDSHYLRTKELMEADP